MVARGTLPLCNANTVWIYFLDALDAWIVHIVPLAYPIRNMFIRMTYVLHVHNLFLDVWHAIVPLIASVVLTILIIWTAAINVLHVLLPSPIVFNVPIAHFVCLAKLVIIWVQMELVYQELTVLIAPIQLSVYHVLLLCRIALTALMIQFVLPVLLETIL
jgi:hypothetical protein